MKWNILANYYPYVMSFGVLVLIAIIFLRLKSKTKKDKLTFNIYAGITLFAIVGMLWYKFSHVI